MKNKIFTKLMTIAVVCFTAVIFTFTSQTANAQPSGLVSYWNADGNANDSISGNNGTLQGNATFTTGIIDQAFSLDGNTSGILIGNPTSLKLTNAITISAWIKTVGPPPSGESLGLASIVTKWAQTFGGPQSDSFGLWVANDNGTMRLLSVLHHADGDDFLLAGVIEPEVFTHVAMTFESTTGVFAIYINGQPVATHATHATPIFTSDHNIMIGKEDSYRIRPFRGLIDEVRIYNRALSASEIQNVVNPLPPGRAYVTNGCNRTISVIDLATNTTIATIPIGAYPESLSVSPDGRRVYTVNPFANTVTVIDTNINAVIATIPVGIYPTDVTFSPDSTRAYVTDYNTFSVYVIDTSTNAVIATISGGSQFLSIAITPDGTRGYATNYFANLVTVLDLTTNSVITTIPGFGIPTTIQVTPDGSRVYVVNQGPDTVSVIDTATNTIMATIPVGLEPVGIKLTPDGTRAYVTNYLGNTVSVIDTSTNTVIQTITGFFHAHRLNITPDGLRVYVANFHGDTVSVINTATNSIIETLTGFSCPFGIAFGSVPPLDSTPPLITPTVTGHLGDNGWYTGNVEVSWGVTDVESSVSSSSGCEISNVTTDTSAVTFTCAATSSGGTSTESVTIKRDATAPSITSSATAGGNPYTAGNWTNQDVIVSFDCSDSLSGVGDVTPPVTLTTEGANQSANGTCHDLAGNSADTSFAGINVDKTAPTISVTSPTSGNYLLNQAVTVSFNCTDSLSGVSDCSGTIANGGGLDTASTGAKTFTVNSADNAGNTASPTVVNYSVGFGIEVLFDQTKAHKSGSTVPIKLRLVDANGANMSSAGTIVHAVSVIQTGSSASTVVEDSGNSNPDFDFRYDQSLGGYIFNLQTKGYTTGTYQLNFIAGNNPTVYSVQFQVRQ